MKDYLSCSQAATELGERNDWAVRAVTMATYQDYDFVHGLFCKVGRRKGYGTSFYMTKQVLEKLGRDVVDVTKHYSARTIVSLKREITPRDNLLVRTRGHILCVNEGEVHDWTKDRRHRIRQILRVVSKR